MPDIASSLWSKKTRELIILYIYNYLFLREYNSDESNLDNNLFDLVDLVEIAFDKKSDEEKQEILKDSQATFNQIKKLIPLEITNYINNLSKFSNNWKFTGVMTKSILVTFCLERQILPIDKLDPDNIKVNFKTLNLYLKISAKYLELTQISTIHAILGKLSL